MPINVLVAEDSSFQRKVISEMLSKHDLIRVVDVARNGLEAVEKVNQLHPDVLVLDLIMPKMDGLTALKEIMKTNPIPTIIFSVLDPKSLDNSVQALIMGAFDYIIKPGGVWKVELPKFKDELISKVLMAAKSQVKQVHGLKRERKQQQDKIITEKTTGNGKVKKSKSVSLPKLPPVRIKNLKNGIIAMGASVGGPRTLKIILSKIPSDFSSPILIVQHINPYFVDEFAKSLSRECKITIKVAENEEYLVPGIAYISPGDYHVIISAKNDRPCIKLLQGEPVHFCMPSIDVLFSSVASTFKTRALGILLTGMGEDGVMGLGMIQRSGGKTIAESQETAVLYGMPKSAAERGVADLILPNYKIKEEMILFSKKIRRS
ncbi:MAG: chemotaxis-specific protein-glutamate methyltransferase CheB [Candidatus Helarchaeota archaeon]